MDDPLATILAKKKYREDKTREDIAKRTAALQPIIDMVEKIASQGGKFHYPSGTSYKPREGPPTAVILWGNAETLQVKLGDGWGIDIQPYEDEDAEMWFYTWKMGGRYGDQEFSKIRLTLDQMREKVLTLLSEWVVNT